MNNEHAWFLYNSSRETPVYRARTLCGEIDVEPVKATGGTLVDDPVTDDVNVACAGCREAAERERKVVTAIERMKTTVLQSLRYRRYPAGSPTAVKTTDGVVGSLAVTLMPEV